MKNIANPRALIVDDEDEARNLLEKLINRLNYLQVIGKAESADAAMNIICKINPEIVFVDVQMPYKDGFQLVQEIKQRNFDPAIIFVTAFSQYAINAIKVSAFDYLLKPVSFDELQETINRYKQELPQNAFQENVDRLVMHLKDAEQIKFHTRTGYILIVMNEIVYCEADVNYTTIYLDKQNKEVVTVNIGRMQEILNKPYFHRLGRSNIINTNYLHKIDTYTRSCILLKNGEKFVIKAPSKHIRELAEMI